MKPEAILYLLFVLGALIAWLVLEMRAGKLARIGAGLFAITLVAITVWIMTLLITQLNYNSYYGKVTRDLIVESLDAMDRGEQARVQTVFRGLRDQFHPTYEGKANFRELGEAATQRLRGDAPIVPGSKWDALQYARETWPGFWEHNGYWLRVDEIGGQWKIQRSGDTSAKIHSIAMSADLTTFTFKEDERWQHTLTLTSPYEATHEWRDLTSGTVSQTTPIYKLGRYQMQPSPPASPSTQAIVEQRKM